MKKFHFAFSVVFFFLFVFLSVAQELAPMTLPGDPLFEKGFRINGRKHGDPKRIVDAGGKDAPGVNPVWSVAQWHSKGTLDRFSVEEGRSRLFDDFKSLTVDHKSGAFNMTVYGGREYADQMNVERKNPWVHLLLSQGDTLKTPMLHTLDKLVVELEFELTEFRSVLDNPPRNHAAQFQLFLYLRGVDPENPNRYKNFTWFGISMFDCRQDFTDDYAAQDFAMQNGQFIYTIGSKNTLKEKVEVAKRLKIEVDLLPYVKKALEA